MNTVEKAAARNRTQANVDHLAKISNIQDKVDELAKQIESARNSQWKAELTASRNALIVKLNGLKRK